MPTHTLEMMAVIFGLMNIYLAVRANVWNWFFGAITVSLYFVIFYYVKLYADMSLQLIFLILQFYGLYQWLYGGEHQRALSIRKATLSTYLTAMISTVCLFSIIATVLHAYTDSTTVAIDAFTTTLSLVAQWMMSKKWLEHWWLWMLVDIISIDMYIGKHLYFTAGLYTVFLFLCMFGYVTWRKQCMHHCHETSP